MNMSKTIGNMMKTKVTLNSGMTLFLQALGASIFIGLIFTYGILSILDYYDYQFSVKTNLIIMLCTILILLVLGCYAAVWEHKKKGIWCLDGNILTRGEPINLSVDLSKVEKAIGGIPMTKLLEFLYTHKLGFLVHQLTRSKYYYTTTLKMSADEYLPLYLFWFDGGSELTESIHLKVQDKIVIDHQFTEQEKEILKIRKVNTLIKR